MLSPNTLLIERAAPLAPCVLVLDGPALDALGGALDFARSLYGAGSEPFRRVLRTSTVPGALRAWTLATPQDAETVALDESLADGVRAVAAALCLGRPLPLAAPGAPLAASDWTVPPVLVEQVERESPTYVGDPLGLGSV